MAEVLIEYYLAGFGLTGILMIIASVIAFFKQILTRR